MDQFDLFVFDLDGTVVNTEYLHYQSYLQTFKSYQSNFNFTFNEYCKVVHFSDNSMQEYIKTNFSFINFEKFYKQKKEYFLQKLDNNLEFCEGFVSFFSEIKNLTKKTAIVTHSDRDVVNKIISQLPLINEFDIIITKDDYHFKKPHPEPYLKAIAHFNGCGCNNIIGFEDSYKGYTSLMNSGIVPVLICNDDYPFLQNMKPIYKFNSFSSIDMNCIKKKNYYHNFSKKYETYIAAINSSKSCTKYIDIISKLVLHNKNNIYLAGIGKCAIVARKCVSTWQSLNISCHYLNVPDLFYGDFGILRDNDIIIYISNCGNTPELINATKYIKQNFNVIQIGITINQNSELKEFVNYSFQIADRNVVIEIDEYALAPTTSSVILMIALDMIGTNISRLSNQTIEQFKLCHPLHDVRVSENVIDYVVIVASGSGSRLMPLTKFIPKILVEFDNFPFIFKLLDYWKDYTKNIIIIINQTFKDLVDFYINLFINMYNINLNVKIKCFDFLTGTADTIQSTITNEYYYKNILFTWCDIVPNCMIDKKLLKTNAIFTFGNQVSYQFKNNEISYVRNGGNVVGIYYLKNFAGIKRYSLGEDLVECLIPNNYDDLSDYQLTDLIDIGEMYKYDCYIKTEFKCRSFNKLTITDEIIIKEPTNNQGIDIIKNEINWYNYLHKYNINHHIIRLDNNKITMNNIKGTTLFKFFNKLENNKKIEITMKLFEKIKTIHNLEKIHVAKENISTDIKIEFYDKVFKRLELSEPILKNIKTQVKYVDNIPLENHNIIINKCFENIQEYLKDRDYYNIILGDCHFSNIIIDGNNELYFIDPRGYFGTTKIFGLFEYDIAKVIYTISGYDDFNNNEKYSFNLIDENIILNINDNLDLLEFIHLDNKKLILSMVVIIWLSLTQYNINNYYKCIASFYRAIYIYKKYLCE
jgi:beta-phosphoglucomutase-like phosphatase (HAD superfamily)/D-arabinose 5-phosphate isomerase GutQ